MQTDNRVKNLEASCPHRYFSLFRPSVSWISRQEVLSATSWGRFTSLRASRDGELTCCNLHKQVNGDPKFNAHVVLLVLTPTLEFYT